MLSHREPFSFPKTKRFVPNEFAHASRTLLPTIMSLVIVVFFFFFLPFFVPVARQNTLPDGVWVVISLQPNRSRVEWNQTDASPDCLVSLIVFTCVKPNGAKWAKT